uniref:V-type proton ATPase subunit F n=1 Tax=Spongospora subterranea TaxID=70186 RepID=A0A0H5QWZ4_9EUKA|eukprot:CRZ06257.1 hypothetical protein [Spongospora subterranea]
MCAAIYQTPAAGSLVAVIGDEDTVTGFLLTGIGDKTNGVANFLIVTDKTNQSTIEETFTSFLERKDIAMILISQHIAERVRPMINSHDKPIPSILEMPAKDVPYDENKDSVMRRVKQILGRD